MELEKAAKDLNGLKQSFIDGVARIEAETASLKDKISTERSAEIMSSDEIQEVKGKIDVNMRDMMAVFDKALARKADEIEQN